MVTVDDCRNCCIFIGPTDSSVFIRNSFNCKLVVIARQLRLRDCTDCRLSLYCRTKPAVESCSGLEFSCFAFPYAGLAAQMCACKLAPFTNFWADGYDYTPEVDHGGGDGSCAAHWHIASRAADDDDSGSGGNGPDVQLERFFFAHSSNISGAVDEQQGSVHLSIASGSSSRSSINQEMLDECEATSSNQTSTQQLPGEVRALLQAASASPFGHDVLCTIQTMGGGPAPAAHQPSGSFLFLLFPPGSSAAVQGLLAVHHLGSSFGSSSAALPQPRASMTEEDGRETSCACTCTLLRTNEAAITLDQLRRMASASGWSGSIITHFVVKGKSAKYKKRRTTSSFKVCTDLASCIGFEVMTAAASSGNESEAAAAVEQHSGAAAARGCGAVGCKRAALIEAAAKIGGLVSTSQAAAELFRYQGLDG